MKVLKKVFLISILIMLLISTVSNAATEEILNYESEIYINEDATMIVEETIQVYAAGIDIKRGIYRDFPTKYKDNYGNNYNVKFEVLEVLRDGKAEPYKTEKKSNGIRVYIGDSDTTLRPGYYTYTIKYETNRQIGYFDDHDELYWNVTGNGWAFNIDEATATVHLPENADMDKVNFEAYTGAQGSTAKQYTAYKDEYNNTVTFRTTSKLYNSEGLTIVVGFEKGLVHEPTFQEKVKYFFSDNKGIFIGLIGAVIIVIYCIITWHKVGKDPKKDIIIPRYNPPDGFSPAEIKYIESMGKYDKVFEASILNLAVKGYIKIETTEKSYFGLKNHEITLIKQEKAIENDISEDEKDIYNNLPKEATLEYSSSLQGKLMNMQTAQKNYLKKKMEGKMYSKNIKMITISAIMSIVVALISLIASMSIVEVPVALFITIWLSIWTSGIAAIFKSVKKSPAIIIVLIPFLLGEVVATGILISLISISMTIIVLLLIVINIIYAILIKAYTKEGRQIKDEIEGFKLFIKTASEDEIKTQTPETFDKYFPYAYALGLENEWAKKFENLLESYNYEPTWCTGMYVGPTFNVSSFTNSFSSSFSKSISSASTPPSSSGSGFSSSGRRRRILWWRWPEEAGGGGW